MIIQIHSTLLIIHKIYTSAFILSLANTQVRANIPDKLTHNQAIISNIKIRSSFYDITCCIVQMDELDDYICNDALCKFATQQWKNLMTTWQSHAVPATLQFELWAMKTLTY